MESIKGEQKTGNDIQSLSNEVTYNGDWIEVELRTPAASTAQPRIIF